MATLKEIGRSGLQRYGGYIHEEFLKDLRGQRGVKVYREMSDNDDIVGAMLIAIEMLLRQAKWTVEPGGSKEADTKAAEFVEECLQDMDDGWSDIISEILSFLTYGWCALEIVYKRRNGRKKDKSLSSKYEDGLIGWQKLPARSQESLYQWEFDDHDNVIGMTQMPAPDYNLITIPIDRLLLFKTRSRKNNPEGRSILRNAYRSWYFKKHIQEIEGIGIERDLAGLPIIRPPEGVDIWGNEEGSEEVYAAALNIVTSVRRDEMEGVVLNNGWEFELLSTGGRRQFDTNAIIERYDTRIAMTALADFILIGHQQTGSFALSSDKTNMFSMAIGAYLDNIADTFNNSAIPTLIELNGDAFKDITDYPVLTHGDVESPDINVFANFISTLVGAQVITPGPALEEFVRDLGGLPFEEEQPDDVGQDPQNTEDQNEKPHDDDLDEPDDTDDVIEPDDVTKARQWLGRM